MWPAHKNVMFYAGTHLQMLANASATIPYWMFAYKYLYKNGIKMVLLVRDLPTEYHLLIQWPSLKMLLMLVAFIAIIAY